MPQFLISSIQKVGDRATLGSEEARHLSVVLRKKAGDEIRLTDGEGSLFRGIIESLSKHAAVVLIREKMSVPQQICQLTLAPALLKGDKMEFVLQKAAELGVNIFFPFTTSRTVVEWKKSPDKITRWHKIAAAASKQCGRATHLRVEEPVTFETLVKKTEAGVKIIFWEEADRSLRDFFRAVPADSMKTVAVLIGPEGGFSREEVDHAVQRGFTPLSLGSLILRAETAAITAISLIQYELGNI